MKWLFFIVCLLLFSNVIGQSNRSIQQWGFSIQYSPNITGSVQIHDQKTVFGQNIFFQVEKSFSKSWGVFANAGAMSTHFAYYDFHLSPGFANIEQHLHFGYAAAFIGPTYHISSFYVEPGFGLAFLNVFIASHYTLDENMMKTSDCILDSKHHVMASANIGNMLTLGHTSEFRSFSIDTGIRGFLIYDTSIYDTFGIGVFFGLRI